jgi:lipopolysaccharide heptosyltransferase II
VDLDIEARKRGVDLSILVTRLRYLGDVILTTPAVAALKSRYPEAHIYYLAEAPYSDILREDPHLDGVISLHDGFFSALREVRSKGFIAAIDLFYNPRSAWILFFSGIPIRLGGTRKWRRHLYTHTFSVPSSVRSATGHHLCALETFDVHGRERPPRIYLLDDERSKGKEILERITGRSEGVVALHPGGTWPSKRWPPAAFADLASRIKKETGKGILVIAGPSEERIARDVVSLAGGDIHVLPVQSIRSLAAVLDSCDALVANDGGVMHLAVSLERPTVGVFGPTEPDIWFPYESMGPYAVVTSREECAPCHLHQCSDMRCLDDLEPEDVYRAFEGVVQWRG